MGKISSTSLFGRRIMYTITLHNLASQLFYNFGVFSTALKRGIIPLFSGVIPSLRLHVCLLVRPSVHPLQWYTDRKKSFPF